MICRCIKDYRDSNVYFKANEKYEFITVPTSSRYPPVYKIYNGKRGHKNFSYIEFNTYFRMTA